jgi:hypothetical protein
MNARITREIVETPHIRSRTNVEAVMRYYEGGGSEAISVISTRRTPTTSSVTPQVSPTSISTVCGA